MERPTAGFKNVKLKPQPEQSKAEKIKVNIPTVGGQKSVDISSRTLLTIGGKKYVETDQTWAVEFLPVIEYLSICHGDVSWALKNYCNLANTKFKIKWHNDEPEANAQKMQTYLETNWDTWYMKNEPLRSYCNDLFMQLGTSGCVSTEHVPNKRLDGIERVVRVWPYTVRIGTEETTLDIKYFQQPKNWINRNPTGSSLLIELNDATFRYFGMSRVGNSMYPVPPLLSAIQPIITQKVVRESIEWTLEKLGLFGALAATFAPLEGIDGESPEQFNARNQAYIEAQIPALLKGFRKGILVGVKDVHELDFKASPTNVKGSGELYKVVDDGVTQGIKQNGNFMGREVSTTETFGRVLLELLKTDATNMQFYVAQVLRDLFELALALSGHAFFPFTVEFDPPTLGDLLKDAQAEEKRIANVVTKIEKNLITQDQGAQELGYPKAAGPKPEPVIPGAGTGTGNQPGNGKEPDKPGKTSPDVTKEPDLKANVKAFLGLSATDRKEEMKFLYQALNADAPLFDYTVPDAYLDPDGNVLESFGNDEFEKHINRYLSKIRKIYKKAVKQLLPQINEALSKLPDTAPVETVQDTVVYVLLSKWPDLFANKITTVITQQVTTIYKTFRSDKSIFLGDTKIPPTPSYSLPDFRAINWAKGFDNMYMGKFVTDPSTISRLNETIRKTYLESPTEIGRNSKALAAVAKEVGITLDMEEYKLRRIVDTSVNRLRNAGNISYMHQAEVESYEVVEVMDRITCPHCQHLNGKSFEVAVNYDKVQAGFQMPYNEFIEKNPFATTVKLDDFTKLTAEELQAQGFTVPPFHPHCRGRLVTAD